jgi:hypothetical protein
VIIEKHGNILNSSADALVLPVNCEGIMPTEFKKRFSLAYEMYKSKPMELGCPRFSSSENQLIVVFPIQQKRGDPTEIKYIQNGLDAMIDSLIFFKNDLPVYSIAVPLLGYRISKKEVLEVMYDKFNQVPWLKIEIYPSKNLAISINK